MSFQSINPYHDSSSCLLSSRYMPYDTNDVLRGTSPLGSSMKPVPSNLVKPFRVPIGDVYDETLLKRGTQRSDITSSNALHSDVEKEHGSLDRYLALCNQKAHLEAQLRVLEANMEQRAHERKRYAVPHKYTLQQLKAPPGASKMGASRRVYSDEVFGVSGVQRGVPVHLFMAPSEPTDSHARLPFPQSSMAVRVPDPSHHTAQLTNRHNGDTHRNKPPGFELFYSTTEFQDAYQNGATFVDAERVSDYPYPRQYPNHVASNGLLENTPPPRYLYEVPKGMPSPSMLHPRPAPISANSTDWDKFHMLHEEADREIHRVASTSAMRHAYVARSAGRRSPTQHYPLLSRATPTGTHPRSPPSHVGTADWLHRDHEQRLEVTQSDQLDEFGKPVRVVSVGNTGMLQMTQISSGSITVLKPHIRDRLVQLGIMSQA